MADLPHFALSEKPVYLLTKEEIDLLPKNEQDLAIQHIGYLKSSGQLALLLAHPPGTIFKTVFDCDLGWKMVVDAEAMFVINAPPIGQRHPHDTDFRFINGPWECARVPTIVRYDPDGGDPHILCEITRVYNADAINKLCHLANLALGAHDEKEDDNG